MSEYPHKAPPSWWVGPLSNAWRQMRHLAPGTALSVVLAMAALSVSSLHGGPLLLYALLIGMAFNYLSEEAKTRPGIDFCGRAMLRLGVGLLGARITAAQIVALGWQTALTVVLGVVTTFLVALAVGRFLKLTLAQRTLSGGAVAICGASAALAISAVLPRNKESERFTLMVVVAVTLLSTMAMLVYPLVATALRLPPELAGIFLGGSIHDVAQAVGAGYMLGTETAEVATIVKLFRVAMLMGVVVIVSAAFKKSREQARAESGESRPGQHDTLPWFLWLFIAMVVLNSLGQFSAPVQKGLTDLSLACLVTAIAALGVKTSFLQLARTGWRPLALILCETLWLAGFVLAVVWWRQ